MRGSNPFRNGLRWIRGSTSSWNRKFTAVATAASGTAAGLTGSLVAIQSYSTLLCESASLANPESSDQRDPHPTWQAGDFVQGLKTIGRSEVMQHQSSEDFWITYRNGVYDVSHFLDEHPGNRARLYLASSANGEISGFWKQLGQHNQPEVHNLLEKYRVANLNEKDVKETDVLAPMVDPELSSDRQWMYDTAFSYEPFIAETPANILARLDRWTEPKFFYVRNHFPVPLHLDMDDCIRLAIEEESSSNKSDEDSGELGTEMAQIRYGDLLQMPQRKLGAFLQCGGHRRSEYKAFGPTKGSKWGVGAVGNGLWQGPSLKSVMIKAGLNVDEIMDKKNGYHVWLIGEDCGPEGIPYGVSIPGWKACDEETVLIATHMNGQPLTRDHGWPARVIVAGWVGARSVKWISEILVSKRECDLESFTKSYRMTQDKKIEMQELPVNSAIHLPLNGQIIHKNELKNGNTLRIAGEAHSGERRIIRVDVSVDGGHQWHSAQFENPEDPTEWTRWTCDVTLPSEIIDDDDSSKGGNTLQLVCRAMDQSHNRQPETCEADLTFNPKGYSANPWHRIQVEVVP